MRADKITPIEPGELSPAVDQILHRWHVQDIVADIIKASSHLPPGIERLCVGLETYWESGLARRKMRLMAESARNSYELRERVRSIGKSLHILIALEIKVTGWLMPGKKARTIFDEAHEIMLEELDAGHRSPRREHLLAMIPKILSGNERE